MRLKKQGILYLIADRKLGDEKILEALAAGVDRVQLREKNVTSAKYLEDALWLKEQAKRTGALFLVNDRLDIALLSGADGVHLGQEDVPVDAAKRLAAECGRPDFIVGATAKTKEQARRALEMGADYLGSGAWHATSTKPEALPIKEETYLEILKAAPIPNVAIGGLTPENCGRPLELGASGLAVAGGILGADSITEAVRRFRERLCENGNRRSGL